MRAATSFFFFDSFKPLWLPKTAKGLGLRCCISQWEREGEPRIDTERAAPGDKRGPGTAGARTTIHQIIEFLLSLSLDGWSSIYLLCSNEKRSRDRHLYIKSDADNSFVPFRFSSEGRRLHRDYSVSKQKGFRFSFSVTKEEIVNWQRLYNPSTPTHNVSSVVFAEANSRRGVCCVSRPEREREKQQLTIWHVTGWTAQGRLLRARLQLPACLPVWRMIIQRGVWLLCVGRRVEKIRTFQQSPRRDSVSTGLRASARFQSFLSFYLLLFYYSTVTSWLGRFVPIRNYWIGGGGIISSSSDSKWIQQVEEERRLR